MEIADIINSLKSTDIINCVVGIIGLITSITAIIISICTARRQYKIDLFDKRMRYYQTCYTIIIGCCVSENDQQVEENLKKQGLEFVCYDFTGAKYLFGQETSDFICDVFENWKIYSAASSYIKNYNDDSVTNELYNDYKKEHRESMKFFNLAREQLPEKFEEFLKMI